jgi:hypothetical protein
MSRHIVTHPNRAAETLRESLLDIQIIQRPAVVGVDQAAQRDTDAIHRLAGEIALHHLPARREKGRRIAPAQLGGNALVRQQHARRLHQPILVVDAPTSMPIA